MTRFIVTVSLLFSLFGVAYSAPVTQPSDAVSLRFDKIEVQALAKAMFAELLKRPYVVDDEVAKKTVSINLQAVQLPEVAYVVSHVLESVGVEVVIRRGIVFIGPRPESKLVVIRLLHRKPSDIAAVLRGAFPSIQQEKAVSMPAGLPIMSPIAGAGSPKQPDGFPATAGAKLADPSAAQQLETVDSDYFIARVSPSDVLAVHELVQLLDKPVDNLQVRAVAYDVTVTNDAGSAFELTANILGGKLGLNLGGPSISRANALTIKTANIEAVLKVLDSDARYRSVSRPVVRVRSGGKGRFSVGEEVPTLGGVTTNVGGATQSVVYRQAGTIFEVQPVVKEGGIDLRIQQTVSGFRQTSTSQLNSPTLNKRELQTDLTVQPGELVIIAGLDADEDSDAGRSFFGFSLGGFRQTSKRQTILLLEVNKT